MPTKLVTCGCATLVISDFFWFGGRASSLMSFEVFRFHHWDFSLTPSEEERPARSLTGVKKMQILIQFPSLYWLGLRHPHVYIIVLPCFNLASKPYQHPPPIPDPKQEDKRFKSHRIWYQTFLTSHPHGSTAAVNFMELHFHALSVLHLDLFHHTGRDLISQAGWFEWLIDHLLCTMFFYAMISICNFDFNLFIALPFQVVTL